MTAKKYGAQRAISERELTLRGDVPSTALRLAEAELVVELTRKVVLDGKWFVDRPVISLATDTPVEYYRSWVLRAEAEAR